MKLRIRSNSIRLRLTRSEVAQLAQSVSVSERVEFPNGSELVYTLESRADLMDLSADFDKGRITVSVPEPAARDWAATARIGIEGQSGRVAVLIEKDFQCLHGEQDPDAFEGLVTCPPLALVPASSSDPE